MSELEPTLTNSHLTATEVLRLMLDERGVEWGNVRNDGSESDYLTEWQFEKKQGKAIAIEWAVGSGLSVEIHRYHLTPEQAIAATLGSCNCSNNCTNSERTETCRDTGESRIFHCSECGIGLDDVYIDDEQHYSFADFPRFCPWCGAKVVSA